MIGNHHLWWLSGPSGSSGDVYGEFIISNFIDI